jgi:hypothetical protein
MYYSSYSVVINNNNGHYLGNIVNYHAVDDVLS